MSKITQFLENLENETITNKYLIGMLESLANLNFPSEEAVTNKTGVYLVLRYLDDTTVTVVEATEGDTVNSVTLKGRYFSKIVQD